MNDYINNKQHAINAILMKQCYVKETVINGGIVYEGALDIHFFKDTVANAVFEFLVFSSIKNKNAIFLDGLTYWFKLSHPIEPEISVKIAIYDNIDGTYFLDVSY